MKAPRQLLKKLREELAEKDKLIEQSAWNALNAYPEIRKRDGLIDKLREELAEAKKENEENLELLRKTSGQVCVLWEELGEKVQECGEKTGFLKALKAEGPDEIRERIQFILAKWDRTRKE
jgi:hypothetical protein